MPTHIQFLSRVFCFLCLISDVCSTSPKIISKIEKLCEAYAISDSICARFVIETNDWFAKRLTINPKYTTYPISDPIKGTELQGLRICPGQRPEDAIAQYFYDNSFHNYSIGEFARPILYNFLCKHHNCDGMDPSPIIGRLTYSYAMDDLVVHHSTFYLRDMYNPIFHADCIGSQMSNIPLDMIYNDVLDELIAAKTHYYLNNVAVSLGSTCHTSMKGVKLKLRQPKSEGYQTGPFDLIVSNYEGLVECILDDFKYFTDSSYLYLVEIEYDFEKLEFFTGDRILYNSKYKFLFPHESLPSKYQEQQWPGGINHFVTDDFKLFKERYNKRIQSFREYMLSGQRINFLYASGDVRNPRQYPRLENALQLRYPDLMYKITLFDSAPLYQNAYLYHHMVMRLNSSNLIY